MVITLNDLRHIERTIGRACEMHVAWHEFGLRVRVTIRHAEYTYAYETKLKAEESPRRAIEEFAGWIKHSFDEALKQGKQE